MTIRGRFRSERGAAAVELALILPILILLVFGIVQFSLAYNRQQGLHAAAREGARIASLPTTTSEEIEQRVEDALEGMTFDSAPTIVITPNTDHPCEGDAVTVEVRVEAENAIDVPLLDAPTVTLKGRGEFRCE